MVSKKVGTDNIPITIDGEINHYEAIDYNKKIFDLNKVIDLMKNHLRDAA